MQLLRAWYPATDGNGLVDEFRLTLSDPASGELLAGTSMPPGAEEITLTHPGITLNCQRQDRFPPLAAAVR